MTQALVCSEGLKGAFCSGLGDLLPERGSCPCSVCFSAAAVCASASVRCMHVCTYMCVYVCTHVCMHLSICAVLHTYRWTCLPTRAHIDGRVHMHTSYVQKCAYKNTLACLLPRSVWAMGPEHLGCGGAVFPTRLRVRPGVGNTWEVVPHPGAGEQGLELGWIAYPCPHPRTNPSHSQACWLARAPGMSAAACGQGCGQGHSGGQGPAWFRPSSRRFPPGQGALGRLL